MTGCLKFVENQMANTFFGFNTTLNEHGDRLGSSPEDIEGLEAEEEYDALNDETFGALESADDLEDWETQHEQLAEIAESSRHSNDIESFLEQVDLNDENSVVKDNVWAYNELKNGEKIHSPYSDSNKLLSGLSNNNDAKAPGNNTFPLGLRANPQIPKLRTVEELERMLLNQSKPPPPQQYGPRFPPGFQPLVNSISPWPSGGPGIPPPGHPGAHPVHPGHPGIVRVMGGRPPPGFMPYGVGIPPIPPNFNFPPPPRLPLPPGLLPPRPMHPRQQYMHPPGQPHPQMLHRMPPPIMQQQYHHGNAGYHNNNQQQQQLEHLKDEYAGLMNNREKQWLLNIQLLQVNTGTPYFDDYYYTVFKERQAKNKDSSGEQRSGNQRYHNRGNVRDGNVGHHQRGNNQNHVQEQQNPVKKTYTPLQFENSLGKLQFGSVTAPRKIIDMDIIATTDSETQNTSRDSRKTKQLLLELEAMYTLLLKAEDLRNPVAVANQEKLVELRQKQRLREMDAAPTPEQKQEVLKLLQAESLTPRETPQDLLSRLLSSLLDTPNSTLLTSLGCSDRLTSFLAVRKGKMLLLRALPQFEIYGDLFHQQVRELWAKVLAALAVVGRRDTSGENIIVKYYPMFKKFINTLDMDQVLELILNLTETIKVENNRSTPLSHQSKAPIHFILQNKFGISALASILQRVYILLPDSSVKQLSDWSAFFLSLIDAISLVASMTSSPLEPISEQCLLRHVELIEKNISQEKKQILERIFVEM